MLVFLVEEPSMADLLNVLLHRLFPGLAFRCIEHEGKQDLEKNIPEKAPCMARTRRALRGDARPGFRGLPHGQGPPKDALQRRWSCRCAHSRGLP